MRKEEEGDLASGEGKLLERERYVLLWSALDGTHGAVRPVEGLETARKELAALNRKNGHRWHIFDLQENKNVKPQATLKYLDGRLQSAASRRA